MQVGNYSVCMLEKDRGLRDGLVPRSELEARYISC